VNRRRVYRLWRGEGLKAPQGQRKRRHLGRSANGCAHHRAERIRSDNGPEFIVGAVRRWLAQAGAEALYVQLGSPWENGYAESFRAPLADLRDELLN
jgi:transposase InsO family protein